MQVFQHQKYRVDISSHEIIDKKVYYMISIRKIEGNIEKVSKKRFSEIETIHNKIIEWLNIFKLDVDPPQLPKKKFLFSTNSSEESIIKRRQQLQMYFHEMLLIDQLYCLDVVEAMLPVGSTKRNSDKSEKSQNSQENKQWNEIHQLKQSYLAKHELSPNQQHKPNPKTQKYFFKFEDYYVKDDSIIYTILIRDAVSRRSWKFNTRYRDLREYHHQIEKQWSNDFNLPEFPEKKVISLVQTEAINERKQLLEEYLNKMFSYEEISESDIMVFFISKSQLKADEIGCRAKLQSSNDLQENINENQPTQQISRRKITC